jgi:hypothetical protein
MDDRGHEIELGRQFAAALDASDFDRVKAFIAVDCRYSRPGQETLVGPAAIVASYRESDARARRDFDVLGYRSDLEPDPAGGIRLNFFDDLGCGGATHTFRCAQIVYFDGTRMIKRIELAELPGERERLSEFCTSHGIHLH